MILNCLILPGSQQVYKSGNTFWISLLEFPLVLDDKNTYSSVFYQHLLVNAILILGFKLLDIS